jgi:hypothetical protein
MQDHSWYAPSLAVPRHRDMDQAAILADELAQHGRRLVTEHGVRASAQQGCPPPRLAAWLARECGIDAIVQPLPSPRPDHPVDHL